MSPGQSAGQRRVAGVAGRPLRCPISGNTGSAAAHRRRALACGDVRHALGLADHRLRARRRVRGRLPRGHRPDRAGRAGDRRDPPGAAGGRPAGRGGARAGGAVPAGRACTWRWSTRGSAPPGAAVALATPGGLLVGPDNGLLPAPRAALGGVTVGGGADRRRGGWRPGCPARSTAGTSSPRWRPGWRSATPLAEAGPAVDPATLVRLPPPVVAPGRRRVHRRGADRRPLRQRPARRTGRRCSTPLGRRRVLGAPAGRRCAGGPSATRRPVAWWCTSTPPAWWRWRSTAAARWTCSGSPRVTGHVRVVGGDCAPCDVRCGMLLRWVNMWVPVGCPCCASRTGGGTCPVCFWTDDGQSDADADAVRGGAERRPEPPARPTQLRRLRGQPPALPGHGPPGPPRRAPLTAPDRGEGGSADAARCRRTRWTGTRG